MVEDKGIVELFSRRDERGIQEARRKYGGFCFKIAINLLGVKEDAEECVSDALYAAWRQIPPAVPRSMRAFLGRITRNLSISRYRTATAQKRGGGMEELLCELEECLPDRKGLDDQVDSRALTELISRWLDSLTTGDRELFVRRYWYGDSLQDMAGDLEQSPRELAQRTFWMRKKLKQVLEREGYTV